MCAGDRSHPRIFVCPFFSGGCGKEGCCLFLLFSTRVFMFSDRTDLFVFRGYDGETHIFELCCLLSPPSSPLFFFVPDPNMYRKKKQNVFVHVKYGDGSQGNVDGGSGKGRNYG